MASVHALYPTGVFTPLMDVKKQWLPLCKGCSEIVEGCPLVILLCTYNTMRHGNLIRNEQKILTGFVLIVSLPIGNICNI